MGTTSTTKIPAVLAVLASLFLATVFTVGPTPGLAEGPRTVYVASGPDLEPALRRSIEDWRLACPSVAMVWDPRRASVTARVEGRWSGQADLLAYARVTRVGSGTRTEIVVNGLQDWRSFDLQSVVDHEVGHALGLGHSRGGLMDAGMDPGSHPRPSARDCP